MDDHERRVNDLLVKYLKCTHCSEFCLPPITQCRNGHNYCRYCDLHGEYCSLCLAHLTDVRNRVAEKLCHKIRLPCIFAVNGCVAQLTQELMTEHVNTCPFVIRCQLRNYHSTNDAGFDPCDWTGSEKELFWHVAASHRGFGKNSETLTHKFPVGNRTDVMLAQCMAHQFWSYMFYDSSTYTMRAMVFFFGTRKEAKRFGFEYEVVRRDRPSAVVIRGDVVCMRGLNTDLKEYFKAGKPSVVLFEGREAFNQIHDLGVFTTTMTIVKKILNSSAKAAQKQDSQMTVNLS